MHIDQATSAELESMLERLEQQHQQFISQQMKLDITRGKPSSAQLDLSNALNTIVGDDYCDEDGTDLRNYGGLTGIPGARKLFGGILGLNESDAASRVFVGGNSSLSLMHYSLWFANFIGIRAEDTAWQAQAQAADSAKTDSAIKVLCPCPGYDRHFSVCAELGIEMIPVRLTGHGPDMDQVEALIKSDPNIKGIWCVPRFSNPTGEVYDDATVERLAALGNIAGDNFYVLWDNAYAVHGIDTDAPALASIDHYASQHGTLDSVIQFGSTSKVTFAGAGIGYMASSESNIAGFTKHFGMASIGSDKLNQLRHLRFLQDSDNLASHMRQHAAIIAPKFAAVANSLANHIKDTGMGEWSDPQGGYFVSFNTRPGLAKTVVALAAEAGLKLTPAGATFPHGNDPDDSNIRIAPTYPTLEDVEAAMEVFVNCVKLASVRQKLAVGELA